MSTLQPPPIQDERALAFSYQMWFNQIRNYVSLISSNTLSTTGTISINYGYILADSSGGAITLTLPPASSKKRFHIKRKNAGANNVTIQRAGTDTIEGAASVTLAAQYKSYTLWGDGSSTWYIEAST